MPCASDGARIFRHCKIHARTGRVQPPGGELMSGAAGMAASGAASSRQALEGDVEEEGSSYETTSEEGEPPPAAPSGAVPTPRFRDAAVGSDEPYRGPRAHQPAMLDVACQTVISFFETRTISVGDDTPLPLEVLGSIRRAAAGSGAPGPEIPAIGQGAQRALPDATEALRAVATPVHEPKKRRKKVREPAHTEATKAEQADPGGNHGGARMPATRASGDDKEAPTGGAPPVLPPMLISRATVEERDAPGAGPAEARLRPAESAELPSEGARPPSAGMSVAEDAAGDRGTRAPSPADPETAADERSAAGPRGSPQRETSDADQEAPGTILRMMLVWMLAVNASGQHHAHVLLVMMAVCFVIDAHFVPDCRLFPVSGL
ncbi:hypothetical protein AK812_SmicGene5391 [Symbiodinium microadriaticum]|uniref:Uncharacterized protein n=1 Tax=Symbiodinium microadriaticum TaxID=2951 RepID=A0A1Q9ETW4_SYMMI|nr:hypothetical protein AK812_SmicGene5391 [Symbiodinium microadriaticum]